MPVSHEQRLKLCPWTEIRWIQVIWTPQLKCYWFPFCTFTIKLMKWNVNDDFMGVMSRKGAGHLYILCIWESVSYLFIMLFILYYYCCLLLNWTVLRLLWHTDISPFAGPIKEFWLWVNHDPWELHEEVSDVIFWSAINVSNILSHYVCVGTVTWFWHEGKGKCIVSLSIVSQMLFFSFNRFWRMRDVSDATKWPFR